MRPTRAAAYAAALVMLASLVAVGSASARPSYFATFTSIYGLTPGQDLYACGVCHRKWEGTGARNPFGVAVEQQLYVGKTITDAILDVAAADTDGDGFSNGDEITVYGTLPGYSCANYTLSIDPPANFQSLITPSVASCLQPKDILVDPLTATFFAEVNTVHSVTINIENNGTDFPITVSDYAMQPGSHSALSVSGPALPIVIPVGGSASLDLSFTSPVTVFGTGTLRITSDDPDEPTIDIAATGISFVKNLAPAADRAACFAEAEKRLQKFSIAHLKEWGRCYVDELQGVACDTGRRDFNIAKAEAKLRSFIGGDKDRRCAGEGLTPTRLDLPTQCGAPCASIAISSIATWADCLVCRQEAAANSMLDAAVGTVPPDLPSNLLGIDAHRCNRSVVSQIERSIKKIQKSLGACEVGNVTAAMPVDCATSLAASIAIDAARPDAALDRCSDTASMKGCRFEMSPAPQCLGTAATDIASDLVDAVFATRP